MVMQGVQQSHTEQKKKSHKNITALENDLKKKKGELTTATESLKNKDEEIAELQFQLKELRATHGAEYQRTFDRG
ncbi:hypothetical protein Acr_00g0100440 [Actinidia rufa]|uniref:Uncharacterized protein n=1 Tax=Actinidia rufa TaxID=165716 RepID=A0A7J0E1K6_9ERIC|nr:hypothetical protein Acr_00g0100440 [Actinidia rufa]